MCFTSCYTTISSKQAVEDFGERMISQYPYIESFDIERGTPTYKMRYTIVDYTPTEEEINYLYEETSDFIFSDEIYYEVQERSRPRNHYFSSIIFVFIVNNGEKEYLHLYVLADSNDTPDTIIPDRDDFVLTTERHEEVSEATQQPIVAPFE